MAQQELTSFGADVKKSLIDHRMSQVELAKMLGIKKQYLNMILYGKRKAGKYEAPIRAALGLKCPHPVPNHVRETIRKAVLDDLHKRTENISAQ